MWPKYGCPGHRQVAKRCRAFAHPRSQTHASAPLPAPGRVETQAPVEGPIAALRVGEERCPPGLGGSRHGATRCCAAPARCASIRWTQLLLALPLIFPRFLTPCKHMGMYGMGQV